MVIARGELWNHFTVRRYAKCGICRRHVSVCMSCHTPVLYEKAKRRMMQIMPHDSPGTQFSDTKVSGEIRTGSPPKGATNAGGVG